MLYESWLCAAARENSPGTARRSPEMSPECLKTHFSHFQNFSFFDLQGRSCAHLDFAVFEPPGLNQGVPKHRFYEMLPKKLPKVTLSTNEYINFQNSPLKIIHLSGKPGTETSPALTAYYSRASARECSTSHCFVQLRRKITQELPGEARRRAQNA